MYAVWGLLWAIGNVLAAVIVWAKQCEAFHGRVGHFGSHTYIKTEYVYT